MGHEGLKPPIDMIGSGAVTRRAASLFSRASSEYFASASAQGAFMTVRMRTRGITTPPIEMGRVLLEDHGAVTDLTAIANEAHRRRGLTFTIDESDTRRMIGSGFAQSHVMDVLQDSDLQHLLRYNKQLRADEPDMSAFDRENDLFRPEVYALINLRRLEQGIWTPVDQEYVNDIADAIEYPEAA